MFITFLWHMHQPIYINPEDGNTLLPWVRLHAVKDYLDMALMIEDTPGMKAVINIVPSLVVQLKEYAEGTAKDRFLACSRKRPTDLSGEDKLFLLKNFFTVNTERKILPSPRYAELLQKRGRDIQHIHDALKRFTPQDFLDLQVHFNLAWCGPYLKKDNKIADLIQKDTGFTQEEKDLLLSKQNSAIEKIIPAYKRLQQNGRVEISVSPFFHPILPLLCDTDEAKTARRCVSLPQNRFSFPEDAENQVRLAVEYYRALWGHEPLGMWPSEGAVSKTTLDIAIQQGIRWLATDEAILKKSLIKKRGETAPLSPRDLYSSYAYQSAHGTLSLFFRNQALSDLIGFTYSSWDETQAAEDFFQKLVEEKNRMGEESKHHLLSIIMDGENAWEYFPEGGEVFLKNLYRKIVDAGQFQPITYGEFLKHPDRHRQKSLTSISPGTWIHADFSTWIGEPAKNDAWDLLFQARQTFQNWLDKLSLTEKKQKKETIDAALKALHTAEGSDWFWWLRKGEKPENERLFEVLMKLYLAHMYKTLNLDVPSTLKIQQSEPIL